MNCSKGMRCSYFCGSQDAYFIEFKGISTTDIVQCTPPSGENLYYVCLQVLRSVDPAFGDKPVVINAAEQTSFFKVASIGLAVEMGPSVLSLDGTQSLICNYLSSLYSEGQKCQDVLAYSAATGDLRTARATMQHIDVLADAFTSMPDESTKDTIAQLTRKYGLGQT